MAIWRRRRMVRMRVVRWAVLLVVALPLLLASCDQASVSTPHATTPPATPRPTASGTSPSASSDWLRFGNDAARDGVAAPGTSISPANVRGLRKLWSVTLPGVADSTPIFLHGMTLADGSVHDLLYMTTSDGQLVALDAATGASIWSQRPAGPKITNSSPVADPDRQYVYAYGLDGSLHKYRATSGQEVTGGGWPVRITLMTGTEKESSAINIANGYIYVATSGYLGDAPPYQGHIVVVRASDASIHVFNSLCSNISHLLGPGDCADQRSGIWARGGVVVDPVTKNIFMTTGNGPYTANTGGSGWGDTILELSLDGATLLDSYTPANYQQLDDADQDLGSAAPALLPGISNSKTPYLLVQGGKDSLLRLVNRQNMSGASGPGHVGGELQAISTPGGSGCGTFTQPAVWTEPATRQIWLFVADTCKLGAFKVVTDATGATRLQLAWTRSLSGTSPVVANGVLVIATSGALWALDPATGATEWTSTQASAGGTIGTIHWESPIVVGGTIYCSDESGSLTAYGL